MKVACVLVSHLPLKVELQRNAHLAGPSREGLILACTVGSRRVVYDFSPELKNIQAGMPLHQALSCHRAAVVIEADVAFYKAAFSQVLDSLEQRSPVVEPGDMGCAYVGLEEMYGSEAELVHALVNAVPDYLAPQVGVGEGKFPAYVAALSALPGGVVKVPEDVRAFLAGRPVEVLTVSRDSVHRLRSFGLKTLGQVASLPLGPLQAQCGREGRLMWELANGIDRSPVVPRRCEENVTERLSFPAPVSSTGAVILAVETLLGHVFAEPALKGRCARLAMLEGRVYGGPPWYRRVAFKEPVGDRRRGLFIIKSHLEAHPVAGPLEELCLTLSELTEEAGRQSSLFPHVRKDEQLREAVKQLEVSLGRRPPVYQVRKVEPWSRLPERRLALVPYAP